MAEITPTKMFHAEVAKPLPNWPMQREAPGISIPAPEVFEDLDEKTRQMIDFLLKEDFKASRASNHVHLKLTLWVIRNKLQAQVKRVFDIILASIALTFASPIFAVTALAIKLDSRGPIFYKQVRVGKGGKLFDCYKFRSMVVNADAMKKELMAQNEADEVVFKMRRDPRITRVGRIIRKLSIDELPQLWNVLIGNMSIVGPRPPVPSEVESYNYTHYHRLDAVPGITGLQQVKGRSDISFKRWVELDLQYIEEQSLWKDIQICLLTIPAVISGKGAY